MFCWRITKYNPTYRNASGAYQKDEWTSFSDIGKKIGATTFTFAEYIIIEDSYVNAISQFLKCNEIQSMRITSLEKYSLPKNLSFYSQPLIDTFHVIVDNLVLDLETIQNVARLVLREDIWCQLVTKHMSVTFGYDYYMYITTDKECMASIILIQQTGLFVEPYTSPREQPKKIY